MRETAGITLLPLYNITGNYTTGGSSNLTEGEIVTVVASVTISVFCIICFFKICSWTLQTRHLKKQRVYCLPLEVLAEKLSKASQSQEECKTSDMCNLDEIETSYQPYSSQRRNSFFDYWQQRQQHHIEAEQRDEGKETKSFKAFIANRRRKTLKFVEQEEIEFIQTTTTMTTIGIEHGSIAPV